MLLDLATENGEKTELRRLYVEQLTEQRRFYVGENKGKNLATKPGENVERDLATKDGENTGKENRQNRQSIGARPEKQVTIWCETPRLSESKLNADNRFMEIHKKGLEEGRHLS